VASDATITADGSDTTLGSFLAGGRVALTLDNSDSTTVTSIAAHSQQVVGTISSIDTTAQTLTIKDLSGDSKTYPISTTATIKLNGSSTTLSDLNDGMFVNLQLSAYDAKTITEIRAFSLFRLVHDHSLEVNATVVSVDTTAQTITVSTNDQGSSATTTYTVDPSAKITADGAATTLASLLAGANVELTISASSASTAIAIAARSQHVAGTLASVDATAKTITLTSHDGTSTTYPLSDTATIIRDGVASTLSNLVVGDRIGLQLSAFDGKTATAITDTTAAVFTHRRRAFGTVTAIDTTANTISITNLFGSTTTTTYALDPSATITADGTSASLGQLAAGARVNLLLTTTGTTTTVAAIIAIQQRAAGTISAIDATAGTVTITPNNGTVAQTYPVSSTATILLNGTASTLSALIAGDHARAILSALDGKTILTLRARTTTS
jgi:Cu/Ag efflux protein CusF